MIVFNSLLKQGLLSIDESTLAFENGKLTAKISMGGYTEVETLPSIAEAKEGVTYLVPTEDYYTMYAVDKTNGKWITLGTTANKSYEFGDGLVENNGVVTLDEKPKAIRDYFIYVDNWDAIVPYLEIQNTLRVHGDITTDSALKGETLKIGSTIGADSTGLYDTRTTYPEDGKYVVNKYLLEERIKDLTLSVPTNLSQLNNDVGFATQSWASSQITSSRNQCVLKSGSTMTGALTINNDLKALPLGYTTSMGVPAYGLQVSSTYGLQLFGTHFLNGTLWGDDGLKIVSNNLSLNSLDEAYISSDYANTTTFRAMPNDGVQATYQFQGWGWDDDSHTTKSPRLGVRLLKPNQATALESTSVLNMEEGDNRWVSLSGGTMTGYLNIPSPTSSSHPTTKSYVDNLVASGGGLQNNATGTGSLSILGEDSTSNYTTSVGYKASAGSVYSTAIGYDSTAIGVSATAIGKNAYAYAGGSTAIGDNATAWGSDSIVIGGDSEATETYSNAIGYKAKASGFISTAIGHYANASSSYATALGSRANASETGVTAISAWNDSGNTKTQFKIIGAGSTASTTKLGGKSGIEYEEYNTSGTITNSGAISFEDLVSGGGVSGDYLPLSGGTVTDNFAVLPLGATTSLGLPAYGLQVSSTYGLQLFGTHFLNGTLWGDDGLKIVNNNLSLTSLDEAFISSDYANTTTFRAMPNDGTQATYKFEGWGWDDDSHTAKSPRLGVRLLKPNQATTLEPTSVLNMEEGDARWVSGTNIKTINGESLLGSGDITISGGGGGLENLATGDYSLSILGQATTSPASTSAGFEANASGQESTALGFQATASAKYSIAIGSCARAPVLAAIAIGRGSDAESNNTVALGTGARSTGIASVAIGGGAKASGEASTSVGISAEASDTRSTALGAEAYAGNPYSTALGAEANSFENYSTAIGYKAKVWDIGVTVISAWNNDGTAKTQLYLIGAGSTMSTTYCDGEAGLGFLSQDGDGEIIKRGTIKLSALMTENTNTFMPYDW